MPQPIQNPSVGKPGQPFRRHRLNAECHLLFSGGDHSTWKEILEDSELRTLEKGAAKPDPMSPILTL
jgi:hypothetical protein